MFKPIIDGNRQVTNNPHSNTTRSNINIPNNKYDKIYIMYCHSSAERKEYNYMTIAATTGVWLITLLVLIHSLSRSSSKTNF